jgi:hypothetical protein
MNEWQGAWHLAKNEWRKERAGMIFTAFFIAYMLLMTNMFYLDAANEQADMSTSWQVDFVQLAILPMLGFPASRTMFRAWRDNCYTRKMIQWRTLPISTRQLVTGRLIQLGGLLAIGSFIYFAILYGITEPLREQIGIGSYFGYFIIWFSYSVAIASTYVFWEQGFSGKIYMLVCIGYAIIFLAIGFLLGAYDKSVTLQLLEAMAEGNWWYMVVAVIGSSAVVFAMYRLTCRRLQVRSFTR